MYRKYPITILLLLTVGLAKLMAFSPYESYLLSDESRRVGLIALTNPENLTDLDKAINRINSRSAKLLAKEGIENLNIFVREVDKNVFVFAYYEYDSRRVDNLTTVLGESCPEIAQLERLLIPHPRASKGQVWLAMEWMNWLGTNKAFPHNKKDIQRMGLMAGLKPDHEQKYRALHQTNWPGVVDMMVKCNYRNWTTFLIELEDELYLFTYTEYIGDYLEADNALMAADPVTQRWWNLTEPCLIDLVGEGNWTPMN